MLSPQRGESSLSLVIHDNDVMHAAHHKSTGSRLYLELISQHIQTTDKASSIDEIIAGIKSQNPSGRFLNPNRDAVMTYTATVQKVYLSLTSQMRKAQKERTGTNAVRKALAEK